MKPILLQANCYKELSFNGILSMVMKWHYLGSCCTSISLIWFFSLIRIELGVCGSDYIRNVITSNINITKYSDLNRMTFK